MHVNMAMVLTIYLMIGLFRHANERPITRIMEIKVRHPLESSKSTSDQTIYAITELTHIV